MKTFIRYLGNKSRHIRYIRNYLPEDISSYTYIEPFLGSGAMFLYLEPKNWIVNDLNQDLINMYENVRDNPEKIIAQINSFSKKTNFMNISNQERKELMVEYMSKFVSMPYNTKRAVYYILLVMMAYNSVIMFNGEYKFKSVDANLLRGFIPTVFTKSYAKNLIEVSRFLNSSAGKIYNLDYKKILRKANKNSFCFIDPPYKEDHDYYFTYNSKDKNDLKELYEEVKKLDKKGVKWMMTQANTENVRNTFKEYNIIEYPVYRGFRNKHDAELIIKNY